MCLLHPSAQQSPNKQGPPCKTYMCAFRGCRVPLSACSKMETTRNPTCSVGVAYFDTYAFGGLRNLSYGWHIGHSHPLGRSQHPKESRTVCVMKNLTKHPKPSSMSETCQLHVDFMSIDGHGPKSRLSPSKHPQSPLK